MLILRSSRLSSPSSSAVVVTPGAMRVVIVVPDGKAVEVYFWMIFLHSFFILLILPLHFRIATIPTRSSFVKSFAVTFTSISFASLYTTSFTSCSTLSFTVYFLRLVYYSPFLPVPRYTYFLHCHFSIQNPQFLHFASQFQYLLLSLHPSALFEF